MSRFSVRRVLALVVVVCATGLTWMPYPGTTARAQPSHALNKADIDRWMKELSNWGRWGKADQAGTVNLITPDRRKAAAQLVREGFSVSLARNADKLKAVDNNSPWEHVMTGTGAKPADEQFAGDTYSVSYQGYGHTHMDSLCHIFYKGKMYNGFSQMEVTDKGPISWPSLTSRQQSSPEVFSSTFLS